MMHLRRWLTIIFFTLTAVSLRAASSADDATEAIINNLLAQFDHVADVVDTVKDEESANKAVQQLKLSEEKIRKIAREMITAAEPSKEKSDMLGERMEKKVLEFSKRIERAKEQIHAAGPAVESTVMKAMTSWGQTMIGLGEQLSKSAGGK
jgi:hypothetical protein